MSEMVERVARALCEFNGVDPADTRGGTWDGGSYPPALQAWAAEARAVIGAMRDPTYDMIKAGVMKRIGPGTAADLVEGEWKAMIAEALSEIVDVPA